MILFEFSQELKEIWSFEDLLILKDTENNKNLIE
jgi:hypothetical protein